MSVGGMNIFARELRDGAAFTDYVTVTCEHCSEVLDEVPVLVAWVRQHGEVRALIDTSDLARLQELGTEKRCGCFGDTVEVRVIGPERDVVFALG